MDIIMEYLKKNHAGVIYHALEEVLLDKALKREFIFTDDSMRQIGKTTALISFAKRFGHGVIVPTYINAKLFAEEFGYSQIYNEGSKLRGTNLLFVTDEGTNTEFLRQELGLSLLTGFVNKNI